jgi:hypothetical protein
MPFLVGDTLLVKTALSRSGTLFGAIRELFGEYIPDPIEETTQNVLNDPLSTVTDLAPELYQTSIDKSKDLLGIKPDIATEEDLTSALKEIGDAQTESAPKPSLEGSNKSTSSNFYMDDEMPAMGNSFHIGTPELTP